MRAIPHPPQRCETCKNFTGQWCKKYTSYLCQIELGLINIVGCASHSDSEQHDAAIRANEKERVLCELLAYINPDSRAGCVINEMLKALRQQGGKPK